MAKLDSYKGSVELISGLRPKNNGDFPLMQAHDIQVDEEGKRLDEKLDDIGEGGDAKEYKTLYEGTVTTEENTVGGTIQLLTGASAYFNAGDYIRITVNGVAHVLTARDESLMLGIDNCYSYVVGNSYLAQIGLYNSVDDGTDFAVSATNNTFKKNFLSFYARTSGTYSIKVERSEVPFGEVIASLGNTLTWDGTDSDTVVDLGGAYLHHVSDNAPTYDDLLGGSVTHSTNITIDLVADTTLFQWNENIVAVLNNQFPCVVITNTDNVALEYSGYTFAFPKKGVYMSKDDGGYVSSVTAPNYNFTKTEIRTIDEKYLPNNILTFDSVDEMNAFNAPDGTIALVPIIAPIITITETFEIGGGGYAVLPDDISAQLTNIYESGNKALYVQALNGDGLPYHCVTMTMTEVDAGDGNIMIFYAGLIGEMIQTFICQGGVWMVQFMSI